MRPLLNHVLIAFGPNLYLYTIIFTMLDRRPLFPGVIEINHQAGWRIGCSVYLLFDENEWILVDIGYEENVDEIIELIRQIDFPISQCR